MAASQKKEGSDWFALFNPRVPRLLDVDLVHTLDHNSVVCCVRFSQDGKYIATGCNRSAQIFDVNTGQRVSLLMDESVDRDGDLYIRSVCFSPDGRYLATGAEDKQIRVSLDRNVLNGGAHCTKGVGYPKPSDPAHIPWSRTRYLFSRLRP
jgi:glucose repression regulatory protein TUP1